VTDHRDTPAQPSATRRTHRRFALTGRSHAFDPRIVAARGDLADVRLADRIFAPHYAAALRLSAVRRAPMLSSHGGDRLSEILQGETFDVLEMSHGYAWGVGEVDGVVGFVETAALGPFQPVSAVVCAPGLAEPLGTRLSSDAMWQYDRDDIDMLDAPSHDIGTFAERLIGVGEVAGGRSGAGLDHGGLISLALSLAGIRAPRFPELQVQGVGHAVAGDAPLLRGDLLFRGGTTAIALDAGHVVTIVEGAVRRIAADAFDAQEAAIRRRLP